jgi:hypothetical protein
MNCMMTAPMRVRSPSGSEDEARARPASPVAASTMRAVRSPGRITICPCSASPSSAAVTTPRKYFSSIAFHLDQPRATGASSSAGPFGAPEPWQPQRRRWLPSSWMPFGRPGSSFLSSRSSCPGEAGPQSTSGFPRRWIRHTAMWGIEPDDELLTAVRCATWIPPRRGRQGSIQVSFGPMPNAGRLLR